MSNRLDQNRQRKRHRARTSYLWAGIMAICALAALFAAIWVVMTVYEKIAGDPKEWAMVSSEEETTELAIEKEDVYGWITDEIGSRYREEDGSFAADSWKIWEGDLYYLKDDGYMATEDMSMDGQVFFFDTDGALKDIQLDTGWRGLTGEDNLQDLDSLVKGNEFWSYLSSDTRYAGIFKPICYRKTTETTERFLGSDTDPEVSTKNSLQIHDGYLYYLPQVTTQTLSSLSREEQELCNKLFRIKPGDPQKELLAEDVTGYLVLEDQRVFYASVGEIKEAMAGTFYPIGEEKYHIQVKDGDCYLIDAMGEIITGDEKGERLVGSRIYTIDRDGKIQDVDPAEQRYGEYLFTLEEEPGDAGKKAIYKADKSGQKTIFAQAPFGIDSFCIVDGTSYHSGVVERSEDGASYSKIFCTDLDGGDPKEISERFKGDIYRMYYYDGKGKIFGEYAPSSEKSCYGQIAVIDLNGTVSVIDDKASRGTSGQADNDWLSLLMVDGNTVTAFWQTCIYEAGGWPWKVTSKKPYQFSDVLQDRIAVGLSDVPFGVNGESGAGASGTVQPSAEQEPAQSSTQTPAQPGSDQAPTQASTQPAANQAPTQAPTQSGSGQTSTQTPTQSGSGQTSTQTPTQSGSGQAPAQTPTQSGSGQAPAQIPTQSGSGQTPVQTPTQSGSGQTSAQTPTQSGSGQAPAQTPAQPQGTAGDPATVSPEAGKIPTVEANPISDIGGGTQDGVLFVGPDGSP